MYLPKFSSLTEGRINSPSLSQAVFKKPSGWRLWGIDNPEGISKPLSFSKNRSSPISPFFPSRLSTGQWIWTDSFFPPNPITQSGRVKGLMLHDKGQPSLGREEKGKHCGHRQQLPATTTPLEKCKVMALLREKAWEPSLNPRALSRTKAQPLESLIVCSMAGCLKEQQMTHVQLLPPPLLKVAGQGQVHSQCPLLDTNEFSLPVLCLSSPPAAHADNCKWD